MDHGFAVLGENFVIHHEPTIPHEPPEGLLDYPKSRLDHKTLGGFGGDCHRPMTHLPHKILESLSEPTLGDDLTHSRQQVTDDPQQPNTHHPDPGHSLWLPTTPTPYPTNQRQQTVCDPRFFPRSVVPFGSAAMGCLDALAVHPQCFRSRWSTCFATDFFSQASVDLFPSAIRSPVAELAVNGLPGREVVWQHSPSSTGTEVVEDGVQHTPQIEFGPSTPLGPASFGFRKERFESLSLLIR